MALTRKISGHVFISYIREDSPHVDALQQTLEAAGIPVWRDTDDLQPGEDWRSKIRQAITADALVFLACFSSRSLARGISYQNEELLLAIDQLRLRQPRDPWFVPVRLDDCEIPEHDIGGGRTLRAIQYIDVFGDQTTEGLTKLVAAVTRTLQGREPDQVQPRPTANSRSLVHRYAEYEVQVEGVVFNLSRKSGGLVVYTASAARGSDVEIRINKDYARKIYANVVGRVINGATEFAAVYPELPVGEHSIECSKVTNIAYDSRTVAVYARRVTEIDLR
jgi:hypothetical protein